MRQIRSCFVALGFVVVAPVLTPLANANDAGDFYEKKDEGWFWGKFVLPEEQEPAATEASQAVVEQPAKPDPLADEPMPPPPATDSGPRPFSPAWLREKLPEYRDRALENPSPENLRAYFYVQRYSVDMAERFAQGAQKVVLADPFLDENSRRPLADYGARIFDERARAATDYVAKQLAGEVALWYFYASDCPVCKAQNPVLTNLQRKLDLAILPIALDGMASPDGHFANFVPNRGHAENLNVQVTPTIFMVKPPNEFVLVSEGLVAESSLKQRMLLGAHEAGWISDDQFNATRAVVPIQIEADLGDLTDEELNDPQRLVEILRAKIINTPVDRTTY